MKISIQINASPYQYQAADTAWNFIQAAIDKGHEIYRVFFYHDGVYNAHRDSRPPGDERDIVKRWSGLQVEHGVDLVVCVSSARWVSNCRIRIVNGGGYRVRSSCYVWCLR